MAGHILQRQLANFNVPLCSSSSGRFVQGQPKRLLDFDPHRGRNAVDAARAIEQQVKADNLEDARAIAPLADVNVLDVGQLIDQIGRAGRFFVDLAESGLGRLLAFVDGALAGP